MAIPFVDPTSTIVELASSKSTPIPPWRFIASGHLYVDDRDTESFLGEIYYTNRALEIRCAVRIRNFVFCLERWIAGSPAHAAMPPEKRSHWWIAAFSGDTHYSFGSLTDGPQQELTKAFLDVVITRYYPILHYEIVADKIRADIAAKGLDAVRKRDAVLQVSWTTKQYEPGEEVFTVGTPGFNPVVVGGPSQQPVARKAAATHDVAPFSNIP
jgi:hypothetical protein